MSIKKIILYSIYLVITTLFILEVVVRISGYSEHYLYDPIYEPYPSCTDIPYVHKPCMKHKRARGMAIINTDRLGLRSVDTCTQYGPKAHSEIRIAITGDSVTFGEGVPETQRTYPVQLQNILKSHYPHITVRVFNFGVSAYSVKEMAATASVRMTEVQPDLMIMAIIPEDLNLSRTGTVDRWGYTVHASGGGIASKDSVLKRYLRHLHSIYLLRDIYYRLRDRFNHTEDNSDKVLDSYRYILRFKETAKKNDIQSMVLLLPSLGHRFSQKFRNRLEQDGIVFLDLSCLANQFSTEKFMASRFDTHPSPAVHKIIAQRLARFINLHFKKLIEQKQ